MALINCTTDVLALLTVSVPLPSTFSVSRGEGGLGLVPVMPEKPMLKLLNVGFPNSPW